MTRGRRKNTATPAWKKALQGMPCYSDFHEYVLKGWPVPQLVRFIQEDLGEFKDIPKTRLTYWVTAYRKSLPPGDVVYDKPPESVAEARLAPYKEKAAKKMLEGIDELKEMEKLFKIQMERIEIDLQRERSNKKLVGQMTQEMRIAKELLESSAKLKMDLGIQKRHLGVVESEQKLITEGSAKLEDPSAQKALGSTESRTKLSNLHAAFQRLIVTSEKEGQDLLGLLDDLSEDSEEDSVES